MQTAVLVEEALALLRNVCIVRADRECRVVCKIRLAPLVTERRMLLIIFDVCSIAAVAGIAPERCRLAGCMGVTTGQRLADYVDGIDVDKQLGVTGVTGVIRAASAAIIHNEVCSLRGLSSVHSVHTRKLGDRVLAVSIHLLVVAGSAFGKLTRIHGRKRDLGGLSVIGVIDDDLGLILAQYNGCDSRHLELFSKRERVRRIIRIGDDKTAFDDLDLSDTAAGSAILAVLTVLTILAVLTVLTILTRLALLALRALRSHSALQDLSGVVAIGDHNLSICIDSKGLDDLFAARARGERKCGTDHATNNAKDHQNFDCKLSDSLNHCLFSLLL